MKRLFFVYPVILTIFLSAVSCRRQEPVTFTGEQDHLIMSVLWFQRSAEMRALFIQGFNVAADRLEAEMASEGNGKPRAVVADLDETMLDNSPFEAWQVITGSGFTDESWKMWTDMAAAKPLPGALEFTRFAESLGVEVFYVSNRSEADAFSTTLENMRRFGFPYADSAHLLLKSETSSKVARRARIVETHDIVLLIGDNLADVDSVFEKRNDYYGMYDVDSLAASFGRKYILLPNPMYGTWADPALTKGEDLSRREQHVRSLSGIKK